MSNLCVASEVLDDLFLVQPATVAVMEPLGEIPMVQGLYIRTRQRAYLGERRVDNTATATCNPHSRATTMLPHKWTRHYK
jgi:hypothetical protein